MRGWILIALLLTISLCLLTPGAALAAPAAHGEHGDAHAKQDEGIFGKALDLGIWTIVVFLLLLFVLKKFAWKPMLEGLHKREESILSAMEEAQKARDEAMKLREELKVEMSKANDKIRELMEEARRDGQRLKDEMVAQANAEIQANRDRMQREFQIAKEQLVQETFNRTTELATLAASKIIRRELSANDHRRLVDEALTELAQANVGWKDRLPH